MRTQYITLIGLFYKNWEDCGGVLTVGWLSNLYPWKGLGVNVKFVIKMGYSNGIQSFSFFNTNPYH